MTGKEAQGLLGQNAMFGKGGIGALAGMLMGALAVPAFLGMLKKGRETMTELEKTALHLVSMLIGKVEEYEKRLAELNEKLAKCVNESIHEAALKENRDLREQVRRLEETLQNMATAAGEQQVKARRPKSK